MDYEDNTPSRNVAPETSPSRHITPSQERSPPDVAHAQEPSRPRHTQTPSSNPYTAVLNQPSRGAAPNSFAISEPRIGSVRAQRTDYADRHSIEYHLLRGGPRHLRALGPSLEAGEVATRRCSLAPGSG